MSEIFLHLSPNSVHSFLQCARELFPADKRTVSNKSKFRLGFSIPVGGRKKSYKGEILQV